MDTTFDMSRKWGWFLAFGIILLILGIIAISMAALTTIVSVIYLGILLLIGGVIALIDTFKSWRDTAGHFILHLITALLYLLAGALLIKNPIAGAISITLVLAIFYIVVGCFRIAASISVRLPQWGWRLFSGLIALLLGILILIHWPASSLFIIGLFVGIDLIFLGWTYIALSISAARAA